MIDISRNFQVHPDRYKQAKRFLLLGQHKPEYCPNPDRSFINTFDDGHCGCWLRGEKPCCYCGFAHFIYKDTTYERRRAHHKGWVGEDAVHHLLVEFGIPHRWARNDSTLRCDFLLADKWALEVKRSANARFAPGWWRQATSAGEHHGLPACVGYRFDNQEWMAACDVNGTLRHMPLESWLVSSGAMA